MPKRRPIPHRRLLPSINLTYDAVHPAVASGWQDALGERVTLATFDKHLWAAAERVGLEAYPADLPIMLETWKAARKSLR